jgi:hypothetical protein
MSSEFWCLAFAVFVLSSLLGFACPVSEIGAVLCGRRLSRIGDRAVLCDRRLSRIGDRGGFTFSSVLGFNLQRRAWLCLSRIGDRGGFTSSQFAWLWELWWLTLVQFGGRLPFSAVWVFFDGFVFIEFRLFLRFGLPDCV